MKKNWVNVGRKKKEGNLRYRSWGWGRGGNGGRNGGGEGGGGVKVGFIRYRE